MSTHRKKLIEVALPLTAINTASAAEKLIHVGTTSNVHAWWAPRPLAACRAVIFASMVDDPGEYLPPERAEAKRGELFALIDRLVQWGANNDARVLEEVRQEIAAHGGSRQVTVVDPFCGRGTIPVEALRLGLDAIGIDLNPVAVSISKALVEAPRSVSGHPAMIARAGQVAAASVGFEGFKDDLEHMAQQVLAAVRPKVQGLYAGTFTGAAAPLAWLWCRTARCPSPACGARIPLVSSMWLSKSPGTRAWLKFERRHVEGRVFPKIEEREQGEPPPPTVTESGATCPVCASPITFAALREQGRAGQMGFQLNAVAIKATRSMRFQAATEAQERIALAVRPRWVPDTLLPDAALGFRVQKYGLTTHRSLFLDRQLEMLGAFADAIGESITQAQRKCGADAEYANALALYLALFFDRLVQTNNALVRWFSRTSGPSKAQPTFDKQTVQMVWDFAEANPLADSTGAWTTCVKYPLTALDCLPLRPGRGIVIQGDAGAAMLQGTGPYLFCTDPPYFDNIGYADLSDFFYVWLRRVLKDTFPAVFRTITVPKTEEIIADPSRHGGDRAAASAFFYERIKAVFRRMHRDASEDFPMSFFYAYKQGEQGEDGGVVSTGWEGLLQAVVDTDWMITGTWPIRTEHANRPRGIGANALASSIVLVCRKRPGIDASITRGELRRLLRGELPAALRLLQQGNVAPVDMAQASIGPGMSIFSRYRRVVEADGSQMSVGVALKLINEVLDEYLASGEGDFDAETRFAVTWYEQHGWEPGSFGEAETLATARNVSVAGVVESGICKSAAGKVRILRRPELPGEYDPDADERPTVWEFTQHMIRRLEDEGEEGAARFLKRLGSRAEVTRELAYRLYNTCERKKWAEDALSYNGLILAWPELEKLSARMTDESAATGGVDKRSKKSTAKTKKQQELFEGDKK
jgi:putative DNA methylase